MSPPPAPQYIGHVICKLRARYRDDVPNNAWSVGSDAPTTMAQEILRGYEDHELVFTDGFVGLTLHECCNATWSVYTGEVLGGSLWRDRLHVLTPESLALLRRHAEGALSVRHASMSARAVDAAEALTKVPPYRAADRERARVRLAAAEQAREDACAILEDLRRVMAG